MALSLGAAGDREEPICSALCVEAFNACEDLRGDFSNQKLVLLPHSDVALCRAEGGEVWDDVIRGTAPDVLRTLQSRLPIRLLCEYDTNMGLYIYDTVHATPAVLLCIKHSDIKLISLNTKTIGD